MIPLILIAAAVAGTAAVAYTFWDEIKSFLKSALEKVKELIKGIILGVCTYIQTEDISKSIKIISKFYSKNKNNQYEETTTTKRITDINDIPEKIRKKAEYANGQEIDITDELENELGV